MAFHYSPKIVTDGLVLALDAANLKSYPGSGTVWKDLSVNKINGTLTNGPTLASANAGIISFDGANDFIDFGSIASTNPLSLYGITNFTIEIWIKANDAGDGFQRIIDKSSGGAGAGGWSIFFGHPAGADSLFIAGGGATLVSQTGGGITDYGNWVHYMFTKSNNTHKIYMNGVFRKTASTSQAIPSTTTNCRIGSWNHSTGRELNGDIASLKIYTKTFSQSEVLQNYNALKGRFV